MHLVVVVVVGSLAFGVAPKNDARVLGPQAPVAEGTVAGRVPIVLAQKVTAKRVIAANVAAAATIYEAATLEEMKLFEVADKLAALYVSGKLPVGQSTGERLYAYLDEDSLDESTRRRIYGHVLGSGPKQVQPNRDFAPLMLRLVNALARFDRVAASKQGRSKSSSRVVQRRARQLALNLSNRTYGAPREAAPGLARKIALARAVVESDELQGTYNAKGAAGLIEAVALKELGARVDAAGLKARAEAGAAVIEWLSKVESPASSSGGASEAESEQLDERVSEAVRTLRRTPTPRSKPRAPSREHARVFALCFDAKHRVVSCTVEEAD